MAKTNTPILLEIQSSTGTPRASALKTPRAGQARAEGANKVGSRSRAASGLSVSCPS
jgi:hypothetical protein